MKNKDKKKNKKVQATSKKDLKKARSLRRNAQNSIKYDMMMSDGVCLYGDGRFSSTIEFDDINYVTENDEQRSSIFNSFMALINSSANNLGFQMTIVNRPISAEDFQKKVFIKEKDDDLNELRKEWNETIDKKLRSDSSKIETKRFFTYTVKEDNLDRARKSLDILQREIRNKLSRSLNVESHVCTGYERLETLHSILQPYKDFQFSYDNIDASMTTKDAIAPDSFDFRPSYYFRTNERYCKAFYLKNWSTELSDDLIYRLSQLEFNQVISLHMRAIERGEDLSLIKTQIAQMEMEKIAFQKKAIRNGYDPEMLPLEFQYAYEEAKGLLEDVQQRNQRLFDCQLLILINASTEEEMRNQEADIQAIFKEKSCELGVLNFEQEDGMNGCLPIGNMYSGKTRLLTTAACSIFIPFISKEIFDDTGIYYGVNSTTANLLYIDRRKLPNPSGWEFGKPGSGKSYSAKKEINLIALTTDDDIIVIDPEREYENYIHSIGGEVANISINSDQKINPWEGDITQTDFMTSKMQFAQTYSATIMGGAGLTANERSIVDRVAHRLYENYINRRAKDGNKAILPTGKEYYEILKSQTETEAKNMAIAHELYSTGSYNLFAEQSTVNSENRIMCYCIRELDEVLRPLGMTVILESLWNRIISNFKKGKRTWIWVDEIYLLFKYDYSANFFYELYKRARKFGAVITGITQNVEDLLGNDKARSMLSNSEFVIMFNQSQSDAEELAELLHISDAQLEHVMRAKPGSGIISVSNSIITFEDDADKNTQFYKMATTNFDEVHSN